MILAYEAEFAQPVRLGHRVLQWLEANNAKSNL
jgi:hypothetical protein